MTHGKEIKYWAEHPDRTNIWIKVGKIWSMTHAPAWNPETIYIVADEWAELRKASADGATIQFKNNYGDWFDEDKDWWERGFYLAIESGCIPSEFRIKPKEWYENIPEQGVLCWVWDKPEQEKKADMVIGYRTGKEYAFRGHFGIWKYAEPIKPEECWQGDTTNE